MHMGLYSGSISIYCIVIILLYNKLLKVIYCLQRLLLQEIIDMSYKSNVLRSNCYRDMSFIINIYNLKNILTTLLCTMNSHDQCYL